MGYRCPLSFSGEGIKKPALLSGSAISRGRSVDSKAGEYIPFLYIVVFIGMVYHCILLDG